MFNTFSGNLRLPGLVSSAAMPRVVTTDELADPLEFSPDNTSSLREAWIRVSLRGFFRGIPLDCSLLSSFTGFIYNNERSDSSITNLYI